MEKGKKTNLQEGWVWVGCVGKHQPIGRFATAHVNRQRATQLGAPKSNSFCPYRAILLACHSFDDAQVGLTSE